MVVCSAARTVLSAWCAVEQKVRTVLQFHRLREWCRSFKAIATTVTTALAIVTLPPHTHTVYLISEGSVPGAASRLLYAAVLWSMGLASVALP